MKWAGHLASIGVCRTWAPSCFPDGGKLFLMTKTTIQLSVLHRRTDTALQNVITLSHLAVEHGTRTGWREVTCSSCDTTQRSPQSVSGAAVPTDRIYGVQAFPLSEGVRCLLAHDATPLDSGSPFFLLYIRESIGSGFFSSFTRYGLITFTSGH